MLENVHAIDAVHRGPIVTDQLDLCFKPEPKSYYKLMHTNH